MAKITQSHEVIDHATGEVKTTSRVICHNHNEEPQYIKLYIRDLQVLCKLTEKQAHALFCLIKRINWENLIYLNPAIRKQIASEMNCSVQQFNNNLLGLKKSNLIKQIANSVFAPDPMLFAKGEWQAIKKLRDDYNSIELNITYTNKGRVLKARKVKR